MSDDIIRYDLLAQEALRGLVRKVLADVAREGLPGEHHFYISFRTGLPGVKLSTRLREQHPQEMTIVLQHQFWDLEVTESSFSVGLSFGGVPEKLVVPFDAITGFMDPSAQFGLKFEPADQDGNEAEAEGAQETAEPAAGIPTPAPAVPEPETGNQENGAQVVSLDKFRKK